MSFQSLHFVLFLAAVFTVNRFLICRTEARKNFLLSASYYFYACWDWRFLGVVLCITIVNFLAGREIARSATPARRRAWLTVAVGTCIGALLYFKSQDFLIASATEILASIGLQADLSLVRVILPIGMSFYTFQALSYTLDIYREEERPTDSLRDFALFVAFFPTLLSGPITRARQLLPQLESPCPDSDRRADDGFALVVRGFVKKIAFADVLAVQLVNPAFASPESYSTLFLVVAVYAYSFQIYMDLSGYTDIARGTAKLLGFDLPENFRRPYQAISVSDFWQRWHISMSGFFRDYLYFGLGGSRRGNVYLNLYLTFVAIGLWHGMGWNFVVYGLIHGGAVSLERWFRRRQAGHDGFLRPGAAGRLVAIFLTFQVVAFSRILFRSEDLAAAGRYVAAIVAPGEGSAPFSVMGVAVLGLAIVLHYTPVSLMRALQAGYGRLPGVLQGALLALLILGLLALYPGDVPFIYLHF